MMDKKRGMGSLIDLMATGCESILGASDVDNKVKKAKGPGKGTAPDARPTVMLQSILVEKMPGAAPFSEQALDVALRSRMIEMGLADPSEYMKYLAQNPREFENMTRMLQEVGGGHHHEADLFDALEEKIIPISVLHRSMKGDGKLRVWVLGADHPIIPYRVAILFRELLEDVWDHYSIEVVCTDDGRLTALSSDPQTILASDLSHLDRSKVSRYFHEDGEVLRPGATISNMVDIRKVDPVKGPWPNDVDLMVCFDGSLVSNKRSMQRWMRVIGRSLSSEAFFYLNGVGTVKMSIPEGVRPVMALLGFYQKIDFQR